MEAIRTSETSVHSNDTTRRYIPQYFKLHTCRRENLKSHKTLHIVAKLDKINLLELGRNLGRSNIIGYVNAEIKLWLNYGVTL
jgi:hypothetical protein